MSWAHHSSSTETRKARSSSFSTSGHISTSFTRTSSGTTRTQQSDTSISHRSSLASSSSSQSTEAEASSKPSNPAFQKLYLLLPNHKCPNKKTCPFHPPEEQEEELQEAEMTLVNKRRSMSLASHEDQVITEQLLAAKLAKINQQISHSLEEGQKLHCPRKTSHDISLPSVELDRLRFDHSQGDFGPAASSTREESVASDLDLDSGVTFDSFSDRELEEDSLPLIQEEAMVPSIAITDTFESRTDDSSAQDQPISDHGSAQTSVSEQATIQEQTVSQEFTLQEPDVISHTAPEFFKELEYLTVIEGSLVKLEVGLTGTPRPTVQWLKNNNRIEENDSRYQTGRYDEHTAWLTIESADVRDSGTYKCVAENTAGAATTEATVRVQKAVEDEPQFQTETLTRPEVRSPQKSPEFTTRLKNTSSPTGVTAHLSCSVSGWPEPVIRWFKDDREIQESSQFNIQNAGGQLSLDIPGTARSHAGKYSVLASNSLGTVTCSCYLDIEDILQPDIPEIDFQRPKFTKKIQDVRVKAGDDATFTCSVTGRPLPALTWQKNMLDFQDSEFVEVKSDDKGHAQLTIRGVRPEDGGLYSCVAQSLAGRAKCTAYLHVIDRPACPATSVEEDDQLVVTQFRREGSSYESGGCLGSPPSLVMLLPETLDIVVGGKLKLDCSVQGYPIPLVTWHKGDRGLMYSQRHRIIACGSLHTMEIAQVMALDKGEYIVRATNIHGTVQSSCFVTILPKGSKVTPPSQYKREGVVISTKESLQAPFFLKQLPQCIEAMVGMSIHLDCILREDIELVRWDQSPLKEKKDFAQTEMEDEGFQGECFSLGSALKENLKDKLDEKFTTDKQNDRSSNKKSSKILELLNFVSPLQDVVCLEGKDASFECLTEGSAELEVTWHKDGKPLAGNNRIREMTEGNKHTLNISGVNSSDAGEYSCKAKSETGRKTTSAVLKVNKVSPTSSPPKKHHHEEKQKLAEQDAQSRTEKPAFSQILPKTLHLTSGECLELSCQLTTLTGVASVRWERDGKKIQEDRSCRESCDASKKQYNLTLDSLTDRDSAKYTCVVYLQGGDLMHCSTRLTVTGKESTPETKEDELAPYFAQGLKDTFLKDGEGLTLTCQVEGNPRPQISWFRDGVEILDSQDFQISSIGSQCKLQVQEIYPEDEGNYSCQAVNKSGQAVSSCYVSVEDLGGDVSADSASTASSRSFEKSRARKGEPTDSKSDGVDKLKADKKPKPEVAPELVVKPRRQFVDEAGDAKFKASFDGPENTALYWSKDGLILTADDHLKMYEADGIHFLEVRGVTARDNGIYKVTVQNSAGSDTAEAELDVFEKPKLLSKGGPEWEQPLEDLTVEEGDSDVRLVCVSRDLIQPQAKWFHNGKELFSGFHIKLTQEAQVATLIIKDIKERDAGQFQCVMTGKNGQLDTCCVLTIASASGREAPTFVTELTDMEVNEGDKLEVNVRLREVQNPEPPEFVSFPLNQSTHTGEAVSFSCRIKGQPMPRVLWKKGNDIIVPNSKYKITQNEDVHTLTVLSTSPADIGDYICYLQNASGRASFICKLHVTNQNRPNSPDSNVRSYRSLSAGPDLADGSTTEAHTSTASSSRMFHQGSKSYHDPSTEVNDSNFTLQESSSPAFKQFRHLENTNSNSFTGDVATNLSKTNFNKNLTSHHMFYSNDVTFMEPKTNVKDMKQGAASTANTLLRTNVQIKDTNTSTPALDMPSSNGHDMIDTDLMPSLTSVLSREVPRGHKVVRSYIEQHTVTGPKYDSQKSHMKRELSMQKISIIEYNPSDPQSEASSLEMTSISSSVPLQQSLSSTVVHRQPRSRSANFRAHSEADLLDQSQASPSLSLRHSGSSSSLLRQTGYSTSSQPRSCSETFPMQEPSQLTEDTPEKKWEQNEDDVFAANYKQTEVANEIPKPDSKSDHKGTNSLSDNLKYDHLKHTQNTQKYMLTKYNQKLNHKEEGKDAVVFHAKPLKIRFSENPIHHQDKLGENNSFQKRLVSDYESSPPTSTINNIDRVTHVQDTSAVSDFRSVKLKPTVAATKDKFDLARSKLMSKSTESIFIDVKLKPVTKPENPLKKSEFSSNAERIKASSKSSDLSKLFPKTNLSPSKHTSGTRTSIGLNSTTVTPKWSTSLKTSVGLDQSKSPLQGSKFQRAFQTNRPRGGTGGKYEKVSSGGVVRSNSYKKSKGVGAKFEAAIKDFTTAKVPYTSPQATFNKKGSLQESPQTVNTTSSSTLISGNIIQQQKGPNYVLPQKRWNKPSTLAVKSSSPKGDINTSDYNFQDNVSDWVTKRKSLQSHGASTLLPSSHDNTPNNLMSTHPTVTDSNSTNDLTPSAITVQESKSDNSNIISDEVKHAKPQQNTGKSYLRQNLYDNTSDDVPKLHTKRYSNLQSNQGIHNYENSLYRFSKATIVDAKGKKTSTYSDNHKVFNEEKSEKGKVSEDIGTNGGHVASTAFVTLKPVSNKVESPGQHIIKVTTHPSLAFIQPPVNAASSSGTNGAQEDPNPSSCPPGLSVTSSKWAEKTKAAESECKEELSPSLKVTDNQHKNIPNSILQLKSESTESQNRNVELSSENSASRTSSRRSRPSRGFPIYPVGDSDPFQELMKDSGIQDSNLSASLMKSAGSSEDSGVIELQDNKGEMPSVQNEAHVNERQFLGFSQDVGAPKFISRRLQKFYENDDFVNEDININFSGTRRASRDRLLSDKTRLEKSGIRSEQKYIEETESNPRNTREGTIPNLENTNVSGENGDHNITRSLRSQRWREKLSAFSSMDFDEESVLSSASSTPETKTVSSSVFTTSPLLASTQTQPSVAPPKSNTSLVNKEQKPGRTEEVTATTTIAKGEKPPSFPVPLKDLRVSEGSRAVLRCQVEGEPRPSVRWLHNQQQIEVSDNVEIQYTDVTAQLTIHKTGSLHSGEFTCWARNSQGTVSSHCLLRVDAQSQPGLSKDQPARPVPSSDLPRQSVTRPNVGKMLISTANESDTEQLSSPGNVRNIVVGQPQASIKDNNSVILSWQGPSISDGSLVSHYVIEAKKGEDNSWSVIVPQCKELSCQIQGLRFSTAYQFRVLAADGDDLGPPSESSDVVSLPDLLMMGDTASEEEELLFQAREVQIKTKEKFEDFYEVEKEVGRGKFGIVYRCRQKLDNTFWAAKIVRCRDKEKENLRREAHIMNKLHHPKLLLLWDAFESARQFVLVMEYVGAGELFERVTRDDYILKESDCIHFTRQICEGVDFMHRTNILHLDLKPENILCVAENSNRIKIIDFGLAREFNKGESIKVLFGTPEFMAPEVINYDEVSYATDMWSLGVICYVLLSGLSPFLGDTEAETLGNVTKGEFDFEDEDFDLISELAKDFINKLLVKNKEQRMLTGECMQHPWLNQDEVDGSSNKRLNTDKLKKFMVRQKWLKTGNAVKAISRMMKSNSFTSTASSSSDLALDTSSVSWLSQKSTELVDTDEELEPNSEEELEQKDTYETQQQVPCSPRQSHSVEKISQSDQELASFEANNARDTFAEPKDVSRLKEVGQTKTVAASSACKTQEVAAKDDNLETLKSLRQSSRMQGSTSLMNNINPTSLHLPNAEAKIMSTPQAPVFTKSMSRCKTCTGDVARFDVVVAGNPLPMVTWFFEEEEIRPDSRHILSCNENTQTFSLTIRDVDEEDGGEYMCRAVNTQGETTCMAELSVLVI